jgi:hypothetical protein
MKQRKPKSDLCRWSCGRITKNHSGICSDCWKAVEPLRSPTDAGYRAWLEHWRAKEAARVINPKRRAASMNAVKTKQTRMNQAEFNAELLGTGVN